MDIDAMGIRLKKLEEKVEAALNAAVPGSDLHERIANLELEVFGRTTAPSDEPPAGEDVEQAPNDELETEQADAGQEQPES